MMRAYKNDGYGSRHIHRCVRYLLSRATKCVVFGIRNLKLWVHGLSVWIEQKLLSLGDVAAIVGVMVAGHTQGLQCSSFLVMTLFSS